MAAPSQKRLLVLGSTGSIGRQTLDVARRAGSAVDVVGLAAHSSHELVLEQVRAFAPRFVALSDEQAAAELEPSLPDGVELLSGPDALETLVRTADFDVALHGVVGAAGLRASIAVLERGRTLALANKESLVIAGSLLMRLAREHGARLVPVDSEHSAIHQCLRGEDTGRVRRIVLTASGGPFRTTPLAELAHVTPQAALRHPNWAMGPRITVGSATLMNKALEVIEVHHLFGLERERIAVVVHPQSIVHSLVEFVDGSVKAQMGPPDMRLPIHYALFDPDRVPFACAGFDVGLYASLTFEEPDVQRFPALELGFRCVEQGSDSGSVLNAADEVAVEAFLKTEIAFQDISRINAAVLERRSGRGGDVDALLEADRSARERAREEVRTLTAAGRSRT